MALPGPTTRLGAMFVENQNRRDRRKMPRGADEFTSHMGEGHLDEALKRRTTHSHSLAAGEEES